MYEDDALVKHRFRSSGSYDRKARRRRSTYGLTAVLVLMAAGAAVGYMWRLYL